VAQIADRWHQRRVARSWQKERETERRSRPPAQGGNPQGIARPQVAASITLEQQRPWRMAGGPNGFQRMEPRMSAPAAANSSSHGRAITGNRRLCIEHFRAHLAGFARGDKKSIPHGSSSADGGLFQWRPLNHRIFLVGLAARPLVPAWASGLSAGGQPRACSFAGGPSLAQRPRLRPRPKDSQTGHCWAAVTDLEFGSFSGSWLHMLSCERRSNGVLRELGCRLSRQRRTIGSRQSTCHLRSGIAARAALSAAGPSLIPASTGGGPGRRAAGRFRGKPAAQPLLPAPLRRPARLSRTR